MRVPLADIGRRARMELIFAEQHGQNVLRHAYCEVPFKVTRVLNWGRPAAHVILMHSTAGVFGGDELECSIRVERGARVLVSQQSATKVHPSAGRCAIQRNNVSVETGGDLQLYLEPVIPFAHSILKQTTRIDVEPGGRLAFWEGLMAGRVGRGERWEFQEFACETHLFLGGASTYLDRFCLPTDLVESPWSMADCNYLGTGICVNDEASGFAAMLHQNLPEVGMDTPASTVAVMRSAFKEGPAFHHCRETFSQYAGRISIG